MKDFRFSVTHEAHNHVVEEPIKYHDFCMAYQHEHDFAVEHAWQMSQTIIALKAEVARLKNAATLDSTGQQLADALSPVP